MVEELDDIKVGGTHEVIIDEKKMLIAPLPFGRMKKLLALVVEQMDKLAALDGQTTTALISGMMESADGAVAEMLPLIFNSNDYPFVTREWIDDNLTLPLAKEVILATMKVNGLEDFFSPRKRVQPTPEVREVRALEETH